MELLCSCAAASVKRSLATIALLLLLVVTLTATAHAQTRTVPPQAGPWMFGFLGPAGSGYSTCRKGANKAAVIQQGIDDFNAHRAAWFTYEPPLGQDVTIYSCASALGLGYPYVGQWFLTLGTGSACQIPHSGLYWIDSCFTSNDLADTLRPEAGNWGATVNTGSAYPYLAFQEGVLVQSIRQLSCPRGFTRRDSGSTFDCIIHDDDVCPIGNPVCPFGGIKLQEEVDYRGAGRGMLEFVRYYRSGGFYTPAGVTSAGQAIGPYWQHTYERRLLLLNYSGGVFATYQAADGKMRHFTSAGTEILNRDGAAARLISQTDGSWVVVMPNSDQEHFDSLGRLTSITLRSGAAITISYGSNGLASTASDQHGRTLSFGYDALKRLVSVTLPGNSTIHYTYDANGNPATVTYPDSTSKTYSYGGVTSDLLTGVTDESNVQFAAYTYDSSRRTKSSQHAGGADKYSFVYESSTATTVTDPLNKSRIYSMESYSGVSHVSNISGGVCPTCGRAMSSTFDANGNVASRLEFNGNLTCYSYDLSRNLETVRVEGFAPGGACPSDLTTYTPTPGTRERKVTTTWDTAYRLPTLIAESDRRIAYIYDANGNVLTKTVTDISVEPK